MSGSVPVTVSISIPKAVADEGGWGAVASSVSGSVAVVAVGTVMSINSVVSHSRVGYRLVVSSVMRSMVSNAVMSPNSSVGCVVSHAVVSRHRVVRSHNIVMSH